VRALALRARAWDRHGRGDAQSWQLPLARARGADVDYHGPLTTVAAIPGSPPIYGTGDEAFARWYVAPKSISEAAMVETV